MTDSKLPKVHDGDWITIGSTDAVICQNLSQTPQWILHVEVVYLDRDRAINEGAHWTGDAWEFDKSGSAGGYADNSDRLSKFVLILRQGKYRYPK
jgi:hypothetical protein